MEPIADRPDSALQQAIEDALVNALGDQGPHVGVATDHGTVTINGELSTDADHGLALASVLGVPGVRSVADDITVRHTRSLQASDTSIAAAAQAALAHAVGFPGGVVRAKVRDKVMTLTGEVSSSGERLAAERAVIYLPGLQQINNRITVSHDR